MLIALNANWSKCQLLSHHQIIDVFYSHKNFMRPELQDKMHTRFDYEVQMLDNIFQSGAAYIFGRINKECWYFYTLNSDRPSVQLQITEPDQTLEIIMQQLDEQKMQIFTKKLCATAKEATARSGIDKVRIHFFSLSKKRQIQSNSKLSLGQIFTDATIDDYLFEPCGYSMVRIYLIVMD